jgi:hypothetical protein
VLLGAMISAQLIPINVVLDWVSVECFQSSFVQCSRKGELEAIRRLAPRLPNACRQTLSEEAAAILETGGALVALDRRDLEAAYRRARATLDELSRSER